LYRQRIDHRAEAGGDSLMAGELGEAISGHLHQDYWQ
jgi:hypothetical protein